MVHNKKTKNLALPNQAPSALIRTALRVAAACGLMVGGSWLVIPFEPVPFTFQVFFVLVTAAWLGPRETLAGQLAYIALGCAGLPVFAFGPGGFWYILGPTGGYLIGFAAAAWFVSAALGRGSRNASLAYKASVLLAGVCVIHAFGVMHLAIVSRQGLGYAFSLGSLPFIPFDVLKAIMALVITDRFGLCGDVRK